MRRSPPHYNFMHGSILVSQNPADGSPDRRKLARGVLELLSPPPFRHLLIVSDIDDGAHGVLDGDL
eukprot:2161430-Pyramimonas_sp.AAC.1